MKRIFLVIFGLWFSVSLSAFAQSPSKLQSKNVAVAVTSPVLGSWDVTNPIVEFDETKASIISEMKLTFYSNGESSASFVIDFFQQGSPTGLGHVKFNAYADFEWEIIDGVLRESLTSFKIFPDKPTADSYKVAQFIENGMNAAPKSNSKILMSNERFLIIEDMERDSIYTFKKRN